MAVMDLPCDGDGVCMVCKAKPTEADSLLCTLCVTPWHVPCLCHPPENMASAASWQCPDCAPPPEDAVADAAPAVAAATGAATGLITSIRAIEADTTLTEQQKAKKRQELLGGAAAMADDEEDEEKDDGKEASESKNSMLNLLDQAFNCSFCMKLPERPVTTPCGHNFCLKCFQKWTSQRKDATCIKCRSRIPPAMASQPRINSTLVMAIRMAKAAKINAPGKTQVYHYIRNDERPEKAFTTDRAKKTGKANACSGAIFVSSPPDHFGPITAEYDPKRNQGVLVGETWEDRFECRQWGAHLPHVAGIAGQSTYGAQSVALSGGYIDDEDHGEWFLYTGSGGRDLSGNKRTNKEQAFDQKFDKMNQALRVSCQKGYPVRVVRSHKEKRSAYAPEKGVRYDGVYRIEKCWRKVGCQGFKVCRYLFVRCDNEPAPWTSDEHGDRPRPLPDIKELKGATDITERKDSPAWDYDEKSGWKWKKSPPASKKPVYVQDPDDAKKQYKRIHQAQHLSVKDKLLKEFSCLICHKVMTLPVTTPCAHNFCKSCLIGAYEGLQFVKERTREGGRSLRAQKVVNKCPCCPTDISEYLKDPQVNREVMDLIQSLQTNSEDESSGVSNDENQGSLNKSNGKVTDHLSATANGISKDSGDTSDTSDVITDADGQANDNHADQRSSASESLPPSSKRQKRDTSTKN